MDYLHRAVERARQKRDGNIGKIPAPGEKVVRPGQYRDDEATLEEGEMGAPISADRSRLPSSNNSSRNPSQPWKSPRKEEDVAEQPNPSRVRYTRTRVVDPEQGKLLQNRVIAGEIDDERAEPYRQLRSQVLSTLKRHNLSALGITSAHSDAGKTLTAVNLAISISLELNQTVMLVDLDLRNPDVHTTFGIDVEMGIVDHLRDGQPLEQILFNPGYPRLVVLPGLPQGRNSSEMMTAPEMKAFLRDIRVRYPKRIIIFDLPPLLRNDDAMAFLPEVDACLFVVEEGATTPDQIQRCMQLLKHSKLVGTILNKAR